ncbi:ribonuclease H-like protein [Hypoxylon rubiginosum]|uniref:Ribonuclease H-like protein n=1 Tax=Hypoxylon rubiginosum TaxID=110542 RepID=A0ACC0DBX0_9PEZI|nr:ribonuclease H-like protein [Hypoxylon rubiginosum]
MEDYYESDDPNTEGLVDYYGDPLRRLFDPDLSSIHYQIRESRLIAHNPQKQLRHMRRFCPRHNSIETDTRTLVINIDGACRSNGTPRARASYGVYVRDGSRYNACGQLGRNLPQTSSRAEIEALWQALHIVEEITSHEREITSVRIACDSEYLVNALAFHIWNWLDNGGYTNGGRRVAHFGRLVDIHEWLDELKYDYGVKVKLWWIPRHKNADADALANQALDDGNI